MQVICKYAESIEWMEQDSSKREINRRHGTRTTTTAVDADFTAWRT